MTDAESAEATPRELTAPEKALAFVMMLLLGPLLFRSSVGRFGGVDKRQLAMSLVGSLLWLAVAYWVIGHV